MEGELRVGRFVTNDGVHVYRSWGILHEDLSPDKYLGTGYGRARVAEAIANAQAEMARRGLTLTVTRLYYALAVAQRKYAAAQAARDTAHHFYSITQDAERVGQVAHSDVVQAEIQDRQAEQAFEELSLAIRSQVGWISPCCCSRLLTRISRSWMIWTHPSPCLHFRKRKEWPSMKIRICAWRWSPSSRRISASPPRRAPFCRRFTRTASLRNRGEFLCSAQRKRWRPEGRLVAEPGLFHNRRSKWPLGIGVRCGASFTRRNINESRRAFELSQAQRQLLSNLYGSYDEATVARGVEESRGTADLAAESLRLIDLRYKAGASTALEVVTAENTLTQARNAYAEAEMHYRVAVATLQTVTGSF